jgi:uncharacterized protein YyaL (SSP411 family)
LGDAPDSEGGRTNGLAQSSSPYLRQHMHNPVDWYPWGREALERARAEDKPILLSIGYSACHWCHVMAHECFENEDIARAMNEGFVCIKVDREERPDLDGLYIRAVQLMTRSGGWPLTVFLTPDLVPFYGGTYFPPEDRGGLPGFPRVLASVREAFEQRRDDVTKTAQDVLDALTAASAPAEGKEEGPSGELLADAVRSLAGEFDMRDGGFGESPKFPQAPVLDLLARLWAYHRDERARLMLSLTLDAMAAGGICDHVGGGFHRYSVDAQWEVPHFEKMLYDNAQLVGIYADGARALGRAGWLRTASRAADYVLEVLRSPEGGFYSAQDADSEGGEGLYYTWTRSEIMDCLGAEEGELFARHMSVTQDGNWEDGWNVLRRAVRFGGMRAFFGRTEDDVSEALEAALHRLRDARELRMPPALDRKVLTDWNALAITGLVRLFRAGREERHLRAARECAEFILGTLLVDGRMMHSWLDGGAGVPGFLSDHALLCEALLDLYESTFEPAWLDAARALGTALVADYWNEGAGAFEDVGRQNEALIVPVRSFSDQPLPSGASAACHALMRLAALESDPGRGEGFQDVVAAALRHAAPVMAQSPLGTAYFLSAALRRLSPSHEFAIVGFGQAGAAELLDAVDSVYLPHLVRCGVPGNGPDDGIGLLAGRRAEGGKPTAYVCFGGACREPVQDAGELRRQLEAIVPSRS